MEPIRVLLVDDHVLVRKGIASLLATQDDLEVVGEAGDGFEALEKAEELMPDVILMDISMPRCDGLTAIDLIKREMPYVKIVMLTYSDDDDNLFEAIKRGAQGYLLKDLQPEVLFESIRGAARGEAPISGAMAAKLLRELSPRERAEPPAAGTEEERLPERPSRKGLLTRREREVLQLVAEGLSNRDIAERLRIAENTVKNHLRNILEKLHMQNRAQAVAYAIRQGWLESAR
jgi:DNA-binding NarL/FixJ family response regulator